MRQVNSWEGCGGFRALINWLAVELLNCARKRQGVETTVGTVSEARTETAGTGDETGTVVPLAVVSDESRPPAE